MSEPLIINRLDAILELVLHRPARRNALSHDLIVGLTDALRAAAEDRDVRCVILTGTPPAFCAGLDLSEVAASAKRHDTSDLHELLVAVESLPQPVVAAVNGPAAAGGAALACACDIAVCAESACIGFPGVRLGIHAPVVVPYALRAAGWRGAAYLLLTGDLVTASRALEHGLVHEVVPDAQVLTRARKIADHIAECPPQAIARTKATLRAVEQGGDAWRELVRRFSGSMSLPEEGLTARDTGSGG